MEQNIKFLRAENRQFADYWFALRGQNTMPAKTDFNPRTITKLLPNIMMLELGEDRKLTFRLIGTAIVTRRGDDLTNKSIEIPPDTSSSFLKTYEQVISWPCGFRNVMQEEYASGRMAMVEIAGFPLAGEDGKPRFIIALSQECSKEYSDLWGRNEVSQITTLDHEFVDIGAGTPPPLERTSTKSPSDKDAEKARKKFKLFSKSA